MLSVLFIETLLLLIVLYLSRVGERLNQNAIDLLQKQVENRSSYLESIPAYRELVARNEEKDSDFYRYEKLSRVTKNDGALAGYPTASLFSSTSNAAVQD